MTNTKLTTLSQAIEQFVFDGATIAMGTTLEALIPFAAGHEIIRQRKRNLTLVGPISDILFDQLIGAGCVTKIKAAWVGNVITGSAYNFRRAVESKSLQIEDHSNLTLAMALHAGAMGVPFMPTRTALGSDLFKTNPGLKIVTCPFTGDRLTAVSAINPDITIIHVQRADEYGNAHCWANLGVTREACLACKHLIITTEEIVAPEVINSDPNRVITPGYRVDAVVHVPWGAYPSPVPGYYNRDHEAFIDYRNHSQTPQAFSAWQARWIDAVSTHQDYMQLVGVERLNSLKLKNHLLAEQVDYGY